MTQIFQEDGTSVPVTVLDVSNVQVSKHLGKAEKASHIEIGKDTATKSTKADQGNYKQLGFVPSYTFRIKVDGELNPETMSIGTKVGADIFAVGDMVDATSINKGKGFQGGVKRWGFKGGSKTHGQSDRWRGPGSIGSGTTLGRVFKGTRMAGHMGAVQQTVRNLQVVDIVPEENLLMVSGAVPGTKGTYVVIKQAVKHNSLKK